MLRYYSECKGAENAPYVRDDVHCNAVEACARVMIVPTAFSGWLLGEGRPRLVNVVCYNRMSSLPLYDCYTKSVPNGENYPQLSQVRL